MSDGRNKMHINLNTGCYTLYFFENQSIVIHDLLLKTYPIRADFKYFYLASERRVFNVLNDQGEIQPVFFKIKISEFLSPLSDGLNVIEPPAALRN